MDIPTLLLDLGATPAVWVVFGMGIAVVFYFGIDRHYMKKYHRIEMKALKDQYKDVNYKYNVLNTWAFFADKTLKLNGLKCGNSQGDVMLDWDSVPTLNDRE